MRDGSIGVAGTDPSRRRRRHDEDDEPQGCDTAVRGDHANSERELGPDRVRRICDDRSKTSVRAMRTSGSQPVDSRPFSNRRILALRSHYSRVCLHNASHLLEAAVMAAKQAEFQGRCIRLVLETARAAGVSRIRLCARALVT